MKIKKGDTVQILSGKDRGKTAPVIHAYPKLDRVLVDGVNVQKKHQRQRGQGKKGQIIEKALSIHVSNVALIDPKSKKPARIGMKMVGEKKVRVSKKTSMEF